MNTKHLTLYLVATWKFPTKVCSSGSSKKQFSIAAGKQAKEIARLLPWKYDNQSSVPRAHVDEQGMGTLFLVVERQRQQTPWVPLASQPSLLGEFQAGERLWARKQRGWDPEARCWRFTSDPGTLTPKHAHTEKVLGKFSLHAWLSSHFAAKGILTRCCGYPSHGWLQRFLSSCFVWHMWNHSASALKPVH